MHSQVKESGIQHAWSLDAQEYCFKKTRNKRWTVMPARVWVDSYANVHIKTEDLHKVFSRSSKFEYIKLA